MLLQKLAMPLPALKATIVLPAFARSLPADGSILNLIMSWAASDNSPKASGAILKDTGIL